MFSLRDIRVYLFANVFLFRNVVVDLSPLSLTVSVNGYISYLHNKDVMKGFARQVVVEAE